MDDELEKKVRDEIARDINKLVRGQMRLTGRPFPVITQVALSHLMAEGRKACTFYGVSFKQWVKESIRGIKYEEAKKLAQAGESEDPEIFLEKHREKNRKLNIEYRKRKRKNARSYRDIKRRFDGLPTRHKKAFLNEVLSDFPPFEGFDEDTLKTIRSVQQALNEQEE